MKRTLLAAALALTATTTGATGAFAFSPAPSPPAETSAPDASPEMTPDMTSPEESPEATSPEESPSAEGSPIGPGCAALESSVAGIADQPVGTALAEVPDLSMLADAVDKAGLAEKLNSAEALTVFAPSNKAFEAIPQEARDKLMANKEQLAKALGYHVVEGKKAPADLEDATLKTLSGGELTVKGSGDDLMVNDAQVSCGNIATSNATVYVVDKVLMPQ